MRGAGLPSLSPGADARQRIAHLSARARELLPVIEAEWAATEAAAAGLEAELPAALTDVLLAAERAVATRPMRKRIADAAGTLAALPTEGTPDAPPSAGSPGAVAPGGAGGAAPPGGARNSARLAALRAIAAS